VILTRAGIRIAQLKAPAYVGSRPSPLPDWLAALRPLSTMICDAVRANRTNALVFGEADRALINDDGAFRLIGELRPTPADIQGVTARINGSGSTSAVGFAVFQFGWLARAPGGDLFGFLVRLDPEGYVSGHPTVKSQRVGGRDLSPPTTPLK
jgi:hypothetical protein